MGESKESPHGRHEYRYMKHEYRYTAVPTGKSYDVFQCVQAPVGGCVNKGGLPPDIENGDPVFVLDYAGKFPVREDHVFVVDPDGLMFYMHKDKFMSEFRPYSNKSPDGAEPVDDAEPDKEPEAAPLVFDDAISVARFLVFRRPYLSRERMPYVALDMLLHPEFAFGRDARPAVRAAMATNPGNRVAAAFDSRQRVYDYIEEKFGAGSAAPVEKYCAAMRWFLVNSRNAVEHIVVAAERTLPGGLVNLLDGAYAKIKYVVETRGVWEAEAAEPDAEPPAAKQKGVRLYTTLNLLEAAKVFNKSQRAALPGVDGPDSPIDLFSILDAAGLENALFALKAVAPEQAAERDRLARLMAAEFAHRVLHIYEELVPGDGRMREAVDAAKAFAFGESDDARLLAARGGAEACVLGKLDGMAPCPNAGGAAKAARSAALSAFDAVGSPIGESVRDAAWDAAWAAAENACRYGASAGSWDAAWDIERARQEDVFRWYLSGKGDA
jgi:hypothetical protein